MNDDFYSEAKQLFAKTGRLVLGPIPAHVTVAPSGDLDILLKQSDSGITLHVIGSKLSDEMQECLGDDLYGWQQILIGEARSFDEAASWAGVIASQGKLFLREPLQEWWRTHIERMTLWAAELLRLEWGQDVQLSFGSPFDEGGITPIATWGQKRVDLIELVFRSCSVQCESGTITSEQAPLFSKRVCFNRMRYVLRSDAQI